MITFLSYFIFFMSMPLVSFAQQIDYTETISILTVYSISSAVLIGVITSFIVLINGRRMKGGVFGETMTYFGVGMLVVLTGSILMLHSSFASGYIPSSLPNILNTIGYIIIAIAGNKLLKVTKNNF